MGSSAFPNFLLKSAADRVGRGRTESACTERAAKDVGREREIGRRGRM